MATFDLQSDVKIYVEQYPDNTFILGLSLLGGPDLLSFATPSWVPLECDVNELAWTRGSSSNLGVLTIPEPATCRMLIQTDDQDPIVNKQMRVGANIKVDIIDASSATVRVFTGRIDSMFVTYDVDGQMLLEITAVDRFKDAINTLYSYPGILPPSMALGDAVEALMGTVGIYKSPSSESGSLIVYSFAGQTPPNPVGEVLGWYLDAEQGWFQLTPDGTEYILLNREHNATAIAAGASVTASNIHSTDPSHLCLTDIQIEFDNFDQANQVTGTLADGITTYTAQNNDSIELYGATQASFELPAVYPGYLEDWANNLTRTMGNKIIRQVSVNGLNTAGEINQALNLQQGDAIQTQFTRNGSTIDETSIVARITHSLTIGSWDAKIEIWKGV